MTRRRTLPITVALALSVSAALAFAGCAPTETTPSPSPAPAETTPVPSLAPTTEPPAPRDASSPLEAIDAYALCRAQTTGYYPGDFALVEFAPFVDATVLLRDDGLWFVYIEVSDGNREPALVDVGASNCIVGGSLGEPEWAQFGVVTRDLSGELIAGYNGPLGSV